jgi:hypothetical protein
MISYLKLILKILARRSDKPIVIIGVFSANYEIMVFFDFLWVILEIQ